MALAIPANYSLVNYNEPESPRFVIDEDIDVESDNLAETKIAIDEKPCDLSKDMNILSIIMKRLQETAIHQGPSTSAKRPRIEIEVSAVGKEQQKDNFQNTCLPHELEKHEQSSTSAKRPRIETKAPSFGEELNKNDFSNKCLPRKFEMDNAELVGREQLSTSGKCSRNEKETSSYAEEQQKDDFLNRILPPEFEMSDLELARRAQLHQREEKLFEKFLEKADAEYPLELAYHDRKARKSVYVCDCNKPDCNECKLWIRNLKSLESRHKANSEYRLNLLRILHLQQRIEQITKIEKMMKAIIFQGFDK